MGFHFNGKNLVKIDFFHKTVWFYFVLIYVCVKYELIGTKFRYKKLYFWFLGFFPIVISIDLHKCGGTPEISL